VKAFYTKLSADRLDTADLFASWDQMTPDQRNACIAEVRIRHEALGDLESELVERNTQRMSFLECMFLGVPILCLILYKLLMVGGYVEPLGAEF